MHTLDIVQFTEESDWDIGYVRKEYSGHIYYGSAFESADSCGTCDGARCETCREVVTDDVLEFSCETDKLKKYLMDAGAPEDVAVEFAYSDSVGSHYKGYYLKWPSSKDLKECNPELYEKLTTMDSEILAEIYLEIPKHQVFGELKDAILSKYGIDTYDHTSFLSKQLDLFWRMYGETNDFLKLPNDRYFITSFGFTDYVFTNPNADGERLRFGNLRFRAHDPKVNDWVCYCDEEGFWKTGQIKEITDEWFSLYSGVVVQKRALLTDVHKIEAFNAERYNRFKDNRLYTGVGSESSVFA